jgi:hypothetical protein
MMSILIMAAASAATATAAGDFDGDGRGDTAVIIRKADGTREAFVTFADGQRGFVTRVEGEANLASVSPDRIAALCEPIKRYMPDCTRGLGSRDREGLWIELINAPARHLALWNGSRFSVVTGLWPKNAASSPTSVRK